MRNSTRAAALVALVVAFLVPAAVAGAQTYPAPPGPDLGGSVDAGNETTTGGGGAADTPRNDDEDEGDVLPNAEEQAPVEETSGAPASVVQVTGSEQSESVEAPAGSLPITGGDVIGLAAFGAGAIALGALLVRRSRRAVTPA